MKTALLLIVLLTSITSRSQSDSLSNSFGEHYKEYNPTLQYRYDNADQIHNYSSNWDFDLDGKTDQLFFIGTGGAHLYYYLRIMLSADNLVRNYPDIVLDFPVLPTAEELRKPGYDPLKIFTSFAVFDADGDGSYDIFIHLDTQSFSSGLKQLKKLGVTSDNLLITFKNSKLQLNNYIR